MPHELSRPPFDVSDDPARIDLDAVHAALARSYWCANIPRDVVERAVRHSLCVGAYDASAGGAQIGFARVVTDRATFAYLCDVYVLESHRGRGVSKLMMQALMTHPELQGLRRWMLMTRDAHGLYRQYGFTPLPDATAAMQLHNLGVYGATTPR